MKVAIGWLIATCVACGQTAPVVCSTQTDSKNCGACGHDCLGAACVAGACQPEVLYTNVAGAPYGIAVDATQVYFTTVQEGGVYACSKTACSATIAPMATGLSQPRGIVSDGKNVYFATLPAVLSCPTSGCPASGPSIFAANQNAPSQLALTADRLFWTTHGSGNDQVLSCPLTGCGGAPAVFADAQLGAEGIAIDDARVFWTNGVTPGGTVNSCPITGCVGAPTVVANNLDIPQTIVSDGTTVFWTNFSGQSAMFCPTTGCATPSILASGAGWYDGIALDATNVYFTGGDATGDALLRCPKTGCPAAPTVLATGQTRPGKIALDDKAIYWTASYAGTVTRLAK